MTLTEFRFRMREEFLRNPVNVDLSDDLLSSYYIEAKNLVLQELMKAEDKSLLPISEVYKVSVSTASENIELDSSDYIIWIDNTMTCQDADGEVFPINMTDITNLLLNKTIDGKPSLFTMKDFQNIVLNNANYSVSADFYYKSIKTNDAQTKIENMGMYDNLILEQGKGLCRNYLNLYRGE